VIDVELAGVVVLVFLFAGLVKGVVGLGLPTVAITLLALILGVKEAMALMLAPAFFTNVWQGLAGGQFLPIWRRTWTMITAAVIFTFLAVEILARADAEVLRGILGVLLFAYAAISLATPQIPPPGKKEPWLSPLIGACSGTAAGLTGTVIVPGVLYLQALGLSRDTLIQAMGILFTIVTLSLAVAMGSQRLVPLDLGILSVVALAPAFLGMALGQRIRKRIPEAKFRRVFFVVLALMGVYLMSRALL